MQGGTLDPRLVKIPGIYVDAIVVGSPEDNNQCLGMPYDGALSGEFRIPVDDIPPLPMDAKKIIARRAAMEPVSYTHLARAAPSSASPKWAWASLPASPAPSACPAAWASPRPRS